MMKFFAIAAVCCLVGATQPVWAQTQGPLGLVTGTHIPSNGLGDGDNGQVWGIATQGTWDADGFLHVFFYAGDSPYASGNATITLPNSFYPVGSNAAGTARARPGCTASSAWTDASYTPDGYINPLQWDLWLGFGYYDNSNATGPTIELLWSGWIAPRSAISVWISCTNKTLGTTS